MKYFWWMALLMLSLPDARAYSLGGPIGTGGDAWQQPVIGYGLVGDLNAPKNLGEEYRRNTPVMYYTFDQTFVDYFHAHGMADIDAAMTVLNSLTNVDNYSQTLSEFPLETRNQNYEAQALGLMDLKSSTLALMIEQLGLADPIRYNWTLHDRDHFGPAPCPAGMEYLVVQRNYDPVGYPIPGSSSIFTPYTPYVNGVLYSYEILEACTGPDPLAIAFPISADPEADTFSPVASLGVIGIGDYYTGLTRDDVAGLKYLLTTNNVNWESPAPDSLVITTNILLSITLTTSNLNELLLNAQTNNPLTALPALFPNVTVVSFTNYWTVSCTPNIVGYLTNFVGEPEGTPPHFVITTNGTTCVPIENFVDVFGNIITNGNRTNFPGFINGRTISLNYSSSTKALLVTTSLGAQVGAPVGSPPITNTTVTSIVITNQPSGEYFTLPVGDCGIKIEYPQPKGYPITNVVVSSNIVASATNANGFVDTQMIITLFTNHTYVVDPITCASAPPTPALFQGIGSVKFVRADFDSLIGQTWQPVTNNYTMVTVTNGALANVQFQRVATQPDFLFASSDQATSPSDSVIGQDLGTRNLNFDEANILAGLDGPGTIQTPTTITFNQAGPLFFNFSGGSLDGTPYFTESPGTDLSDFYFAVYFLWASYDGTTNDPHVYPDSLGLDDVQQLILTQISPATLPILTQGTTYANIATFTATGGGFTGPFTWSATGLPSGLNLASDGTLSGTPTQSGIFDFTLILTDSLGRSGHWIYTITIQ